MCHGGGTWAEHPGLPTTPCTLDAGPGWLLHLGSLPSGSRRVRQSKALAGDERVGWRRWRCSSCSLPSYTGGQGCIPLGKAVCHGAASHRHSYSDGYRDHSQPRPLGLRTAMVAGSQVCPPSLGDFPSACPRLCKWVLHSTLSVGVCQPISYRDLIESIKV